MRKSPIPITGHGSEWVVPQTERIGFKLTLGGKPSAAPAGSDATCYLDGFSRLYSTRNNWLPSVDLNSEGRPFPLSS